MMNTIRAICKSLKDYESRREISVRDRYIGG